MLFALALTVWLPGTVGTGASRTLLAGPQLPPMVNLSRAGRAPLDSRIRNIVQNEMQNVGLLRAADPTFRRTGFDRSTASPNAATEREVTALLTPFGVYRSGSAGLATVLVSLVSLLAAGTLVLFFAPQRLARIRDVIGGSGVQALRLEAIGLLALLLAVALLLVLVALVVDIIFAAVLAFLLAIASYAGLVAVSLSLGRWMRRRLSPRAGSPVGDLSIGLLAIFPLGLVPWLGWLFVLLLVALGFGALVASRFGSEESWSLDALRDGAVSP